MDTKHRLTRVNKMVIMILLGIFTVAELMYIAPEYTWGVIKILEIMKMILS